MNMVDWKYSSFFSLEVWRWHNLGTGDQVLGIASSVSVEQNDPTAAAISICTIQNPLQSVQSRKGPNVAQRALRGANHASPSYPPASSERPLSDAGTLARLQRALDGA